eukprot:TRINITY_DN21927_c0_g1_i1.p2 TRINITY_DN21927_c0_g1~~TRINITY_DN21927_c0_g1_i1.p2  ORF type:complete len:172 (-),score=23.01 TRINITY_DN21927_c0_g1_i1:78-593(-)
MAPRRTSPSEWAAALLVLAACVEHVASCDRSYSCSNEIEPRKFSGAASHTDSSGKCIHGHAQYNNGGCDFSKCGFNEGPCQCVSEAIATKDQHRGIFLIMGVIGLLTFVGGAFWAWFRFILPKKKMSDIDEGGRLCIGWNICCGLIALVQGIIMTYMGAQPFDYFICEPKS